MRIPFVKSLIEFDKRVLYQGSVRNDKAYSLEDLQDLLFFNKVFISNTDEIFERHRCNIIFKDFVKCLKVYIFNISKIKDKISETCRDLLEVNMNSDIDLISRSTNIIFPKLNKEIKLIPYSDFRDLRDKLSSGKLYFISLDKSKLATINPSSVILKEPFLYTNEKNIVYWSTVEAIIYYLSITLKDTNIIAIRIIRDEDNIISKIEYYSHKDGNIDTMKRIFGDNLIIKNKFIYTDDIVQLIDRNKATPNPIEVQSDMQYDLDTILQRDVLMEYPTDSFMEFLAFLRNIVESWCVKRLYLTLYRIGDDPAIFDILKLGISKGIEIFVNIELCATGESINQYWADEFRRIGVKVTTYGYQELKVHSKAVLIDLIDGRSVAQIGTGNYHTKTTLQYTDLSIITSNQKVCKEVRKLFKLLNDKDVAFSDNLLITRHNFLDEFVKLIRREGAKGEDGLIIIKCNSLDDDLIINELEAAADNGCTIIGIIRGVCTWVPLDENVTIKSIVWDKLEHSRVYSFGKCNPDIYVGSLDLVTNKIQRRIESLLRVDDVDILIELCDYLNRYITSTKGSWIMLEDGSYIRE